MMAPSRLTMTKHQFAHLITELSRRGGGYRESGAFILAASAVVDSSRRNPDGVPVSSFAFYDDLDPESLTGNIAFSAKGYSALGVLCRDRSLRVVGDIHTHPSEWVQQSSIDAANPMAARRGHIAIIAPNYGLGRIHLQDLGVHVFEGSKKWKSHFDDDVYAVLQISGFIKTPFAVQRTFQKLMKQVLNFGRRSTARKDR